jgi:hypothetical protein
MIQQRNSTKQTLEKVKGEREGEGEKARINK